MNKFFIRQLLEALAVGDSFAKSTEFASREQIKRSFQSIDNLLSPSEALSHKDMNYAQVTDDTEQNIFLLEDYCKSSCISPEIAARSLLRWYDLSSEPEKYIGPSSRKAILSIKKGVDLHLTGSSGTSCGGIMRVPSAFLCSIDLDSLHNNIVSTLFPTHYTNPALEAAFGYAYALFAATVNNNIDYIIQEAQKGCEIGHRIKKEEPDTTCLPSCTARLPVLVHYLVQFKSDDELLDFLFYVFGTTISSCDVFTAALSLFLWCREDVFKSIRMSAMLGGDTDTIGCLAAVLCCCYAKGHNIPEQIVHTVVFSNHLQLEDLSGQIVQFRERQLQYKLRKSEEELQ